MADGEGIFTEAVERQHEGKRWLVMPAAYFHFSKDRPWYDQEGHALAILDEVWLSDMGGPLGEKALFKIATVKFFREDYKDADFYYAKVYETDSAGHLAAADETRLDRISVRAVQRAGEILKARGRTDRVNRLD